MALAADLVQKGIESRHADFLGDTFQSGIAAAGNSLATATPIVASINRVTTATLVTAFCVRLPQVSATPHSRIVIRNDVAGITIAAFPDALDSFDALATGASINITSGAALIFHKCGANLWVTR